MTLYHFGNCLALLYVPYYLTYNAVLSEYGAFYKVMQSAGMYMFTQLCKMLVLATFFPDSLTAHDNFNFIAELLRASIDVIDLLGIALMLSKIPGKGHSKLISVGLGWSTAELVLSRALTLWVGARGAEFSWVYIQQCLESNILLIQNLSTTTLLWLYSRHDLHKKYVVILLLATTIFKPIWIEVIFHNLAIGSWTQLAFKALIACVIGVSSLNIYAGLAQLIGI
ncbi:BOS complex subunit TMEM147 [Culicoides brevitarsis]|uniref:BOS complex subunit TMEM147 n=1 Tax=Culicoides brevitarsis TaxID=469753 RepID=UPI00307BBBBF